MEKIRLAFAYDCVSPTLPFPSSQLQE